MHELASKVVAEVGKVDTKELGLWICFPPLDLLHPCCCSDPLPPSDGSSPGTSAMVWGGEERMEMGEVAAVEVGEGAAVERKR